MVRDTQRGQIAFEQPRNPMKIGSSRWPLFNLYIIGFLVSYTKPKKEHEATMQSLNTVDTKAPADLSILKCHFPKAQGI